jgi:hypothetical protein
MAQTLSLRDVNRALLSRQLLLDRLSMPADEPGRAARVVQTIEHLVGLQAQAPFPPYYGLHSRLDGFRPGDLAARLTDRSVVRIALMRGTIHLVSARDCLPLRRLLQPVIERGMQGAHGRYLPGVDRAALAAAGPARAARTRAVWGLAGVSRHTSAEHWLGLRPGEPEAAPELDELVLRYLGAFGPATVRDVAAWSRLTGLRAAVERLRPSLVTFRDQQGAELFDLPSAPRPGGDVPALVRLVAEFDNLVLSHADRSRVISAANAKRFYPVNGVIPGSVLIDGFVAGMWRVARGRGAATLTIELFGPTRQRAGLAEEAERVLSFCAPDASPDIRFGPLV